MADNEKLTPEEEDVRNQAMLQDLRSMHAPAATAQSLERVQTRLLATERTSTLNSMPTSRQFMRKTKQGRIQSMHDMPIPIAHKKGHYLNMLAAGVVAALLVGSLLFAVTRVYQSNIGGGGPVTPQVPISKATPTLEPVFSGDPAWKLVATFRGTGSTTITKFHLKFPYALGTRVVCTGKGDVKIRYDNLGTIGFGGTCRSMAQGEIFVWDGGAYTVEIVSIVVDKNSSWELQLTNCVNKSACGSPSKTVTPTPAPTLIPSPIPTVAPRSILTPTPMPILTPTVAPRSNPIPLPTPTLVPSH
jgi:hypothetical protein